jgi:hypothetical protein
MSIEGSRRLDAGPVRRQSRTRFTRETTSRGFQKQATLDSGRRVDLLCERTELKQLVAIELKVREPDDRATGQIEQYLDDLARYSKKHGYDSAQLILIAGQPDKSVRNRVEHDASTRGLTVRFLLYRVQMELLAHP